MAPLNYVSDLKVVIRDIYSNVHLVSNNKYLYGYDTMTYKTAMF